MNEEELIKEYNANPEAFKAKLSLGNQSQVYIDNLLKQLQILWYSKQLGDERITKIVERKILPMFDLLATEMGKTVNEYQEKYGEI